MLEWRQALRREQQFETTFNRDIFIAQQLDSIDPLRNYRKEFYFPEGGKLYMDGNSLGLASKRAIRAAKEVVKDWKKRGIGGWTQGERPWFFLPEKLAAIEATLVGANPESVIVTNSTSINLNQVLHTFYHPLSEKKTIISDEYSFPTDIYAISSRMNDSGLDPNTYLKKVTNRDGLIEENDIITMMEQTPDAGMIILPTVIYTNGQLLDIKRITAEAHKRGISVCFDASHSIGSVPHKFDEWDVDFAVWCGYKYLNGGPGAVAGLYVNQKHLGTSPGIAGWFGSDKSAQFDMSHTPQYANTAGAYQVGTPQMLSMAPLIGSLTMFQEAGMDAIRGKSLQLTNYGMHIIDTHLSQYGFSISTPREVDRRGGHIALVHSNAKQINQALIKRGVVPDFRPPNIIRLAPIALYTSYEDVYKTVNVIQSIMESGEYLQFKNERGLVA